MTEAIQNNVAPKAQQRPDVGIITPPDRSVTPKLIPESAPPKMVAQLNHDVFDKDKKALSFNDTLQTPVGVKVLFGIIGSVAAFFGVKGLIKHFKK